MKLFIKNVGDSPYTHAVALATVASAINLVDQMGLSPGGSHLALLLAVVAVVGGLMTFLGLQWRGSVYAAYGVERVGQSLLFCAWLIDAAIIYMFVGWSSALFVPLFLGFAAAVRFFKLRKAQKEIENTVEQAVVRHKRDKRNRAVGD